MKITIDDLSPMQREIPILDLATAKIILCVDMKNNKVSYYAGISNSPEYRDVEMYKMNSIEEAVDYINRNDR